MERDLARILREHPRPWRVDTGANGHEVVDARERRVFPDHEPMTIADALVALANEGA